MRYFMQRALPGVGEDGRVEQPQPPARVDEQARIAIGKPGVSAMVNRGLHVRLPWRSRAPSILTSSAVRSPEPWNQQTSRSPLGVSTMHEAWLCQSSSGKMSSDSRKGVFWLAELRLAGQQTWAVRQESKNKDRPAFIGCFGRCWLTLAPVGSDARRCPSCWRRSRRGDRRCSDPWP